QTRRQQPRGAWVPHPRQQQRGGGAGTAEDAQRGQRDLGLYQREQVKGGRNQGEQQYRGREAHNPLSRARAQPGEGGNSHVARRARVSAVHVPLRRVRDNRYKPANTRMAVPRRAADTLATSVTNPRTRAPINSVRKWPCRGGR